ncbi:MAG: hypothetical protein WKF76_12975 [Nocardioidaceae bacterium]
MERHLQQQVTELLAQVVTVAGLDRVDRLVGLLEQVAHQALVGLLLVPGALRPQPVHHLDQVEQARADRVERTDKDLHLRAGQGALVVLGPAYDMGGELVDEVAVELTG